MKGLAFLDLDGSVISSRQAGWGDDLEPIVFNAEGRPISFINRQQRALLDLLASVCRLIPVTARDIADFRRVRLPFSDYAICSFGTVILTPAGEIEPTWHQLMSEGAERERDNIGSMVEQVMAVATALDMRVYVQLMEDAGLQLYVNVKQIDPEAGRLGRLAEVMLDHLPAGWWTHANGNNLAFLPPFLGKEQAVDWFLTNLAQPHSLRIGLGDSLSDLGFMALSHFAIVPVHSQIFAQAMAVNAVATAGKER